MIIFSMFQKKNQKFPKILFKLCLFAPGGRAFGGHLFVPALCGLHRGRDGHEYGKKRGGGCEKYKKFHIINYLQNFVTV